MIVNTTLTSSSSEISEVLLSKTGCQDKRIHFLNRIVGSTNDQLNGGKIVHSYHMLPPD